MIKVSNLTLELGGRIILENLGFELGAGKTLVVLGKNGSGKSVLLKTIAGLIKGYSGSIKIDEAGSKIAYVFQKGGLFDSIDVFRNVAFPLRNSGLADEKIEEIVTGSLESVGLKNVQGKFPSELSGGMQKRVGLARALVQGAQIILYDDPTAGLDPILSDAISDLMNDIRTRTGAASIVATHDLRVAQKIADSVMLIYTGRPVFYGSAADFFSKDDGFARQFIEGDIEGPIDVYKL
ncbi:MAG TPA: ATP-binding cassette domain-containing protein [Spirochaetota bacterium]|nr:ATP-binding cassette domain-containing protein [Spirochaetota bacterium]